MSSDSSRIINIVFNYVQLHTIVLVHLSLSHHAQSI